MTDREKLIELLCEADRICNNKPCITCKHQDNLIIASLARSKMRTIRNPARKREGK